MGSVAQYGQLKSQQNDRVDQYQIELEYPVIADQERQRDRTGEHCRKTDKLPGAQRHPREPGRDQIGRGCFCAQRGHNL